MHLVRDVIVAFIGGVIALVIGLIVTDATRTHQAWVYVGSLGVCGLVLGILHLPGAIRRRRDAFRVEVIAAAREQILAGLGSDVPKRQSSSMDVDFAGLQESKPVDEAAKLSVLLEEGRMLQGGLRSSEIENVIIYGDEAAAIGRWEGKARAALVLMPNFLRDFENAPGFDGFTLSYGETYRRMNVQLEALESAIRVANKARKP